MSERTERIVADIALVATFVLAFLTHENGAVIHSLVSLVFTAVLIHHVKHSWSAYRRPRRRSKWAVNQTIAMLMAATTVTGLTFWIGGDDYALAHGPLSVAAAIAVLPHAWVHRRRVVRLVRRQSNTSAGSAG